MIRHPECAPAPRLWALEFNRFAVSQCHAPPNRFAFHGGAAITFEPNAEGVQLQSSGSRSSTPGRFLKRCLLDNAALCNAFSAKWSADFDHPGCGRYGDRPWALELNTFGVQSPKHHNRKAMPPLFLRSLASGRQYCLLWMRCPSGRQHAHAKQPSSIASVSMLCFARACHPRCLCARRLGRAGKLA